MKERLIVYRIIDLDNCIADDQHRHGLIDMDKAGDARWEQYHLAAAADPLANHDLVRTELTLLILTARPVTVAALTVDWLRLHGINYQFMLMRNRHNYLSSVDLKRQQVDWLQDLYDVPLTAIIDAYDDREDVVQMYRSLGINAHVRAINHRE